MYKGTLKRNRRTLFSPIRLSQPNLRGSRFQSTRKPNTAQGSLQGSPERLETGIQDSLTNNWQDSVAEIGNLVEWNPESRTDLDFVTLGDLSVAHLPLFLYNTLRS